MNLNSKKILIVDDEEDIRDFLKLILEREGALVREASNGKEALEIVLGFLPHLILMDKLMPEMNGIEACHEIRLMPNLVQPKIVILSAIGDDESQVEGLDIGADDYLVKPIKSKLLISKLKSILRSSKESPNLETIHYKQFSANKSKFIVSIEDQSGVRDLVLPRKEFELFFLLISKPDHVFRRDEILEHVWGKDVVIGDRTIDVHIRKLREKLGDQYFKTISGIGYKFVAF